jgi:hypothetical protein
MDKLIHQRHRHFVLGMLKEITYFLLISGNLSIGLAAEKKPSPVSEVDVESADLPCEVSTLSYQVALLDRLHVTLPDGDIKVFQVSQEGVIDLEGEKTPVKGMKRDDFLALAKKRYPGAKNIYLEEFRPNRISVLGEVFHQLNSELADGPMRVMDAIAAANGFTPLANQRRVKLVRQNAGRVEVYELDLRQMMKGEGMKQNLLLRPGDVITVPRNFL